MYKFEVGDIANGVKTSEKYMEAIDYVTALERVVEGANLYVEGWDKEAEEHIIGVREVKSIEMCDLRLLERKS